MKLKELKEDENRILYSQNHCEKVIEQIRPLLKGHSIRDMEKILTNAIHRFKTESIILQNPDYKNC